MARPHKPGEEKRVCSLRVRVTKAEKEALEKVAKEDGLNVSDWMRGKTLGSKPRLRKPTPDREIQLRYLAALGKVGSNLNQLARAANRRQNNEDYELPLRELNWLINELRELSAEIRKLYKYGNQRTD